MRRYIIIFIASIFLFGSCIKEDETFSNDKQGNFDALWEIIDTRYCFLDYKKIDWDAVKIEYQNKLNGVSNNYELFDLFAEMLAELKDGHVNLYTSFDISRYTAWYSDSAQNFYSSIIYSDRYLGTDYRITGGMHYKKIAGGKIGYVYYGSFSDAFGDGNFYSIVDSFKDCDGIIIDVRDNGGGSLTYSERLASYFYKEETVTGYIKHKTGKGHSDFSEAVATKTPHNESIFWGKPVAVLTNRSSFSATNDFVNRIQEAPQVFTVGSWTGGGGGLPRSSELPNGWMLRFSACPMYDVNGNHIEFGIAPDHWVLISDEDNANNIDTVIEKAVELIQK
jgi:hypothetical protein